MKKTSLINAVSIAVIAFISTNSYAEEVAENKPEHDLVVVFGQRKAEKNSIEQHKNSTILKEVVTANDAGKLPDQNVAESVERLVGVSTLNDQGEGRYVKIRGLDQHLAAVRINGQDAAAPESGDRSVKLDTIPIGLIGSIDVIKNQSAEYDTNAIAGVVDVKTISAFDKKKPFASARYSGSLIDINQKIAYDADASGAMRFGANKEFGVAVAINASRRPQASQNVQGSSNWTVDKAGNYIPDSWKLRDYNVIRNRQGGAINLDYRPNDDMKFYLKTLVCISQIWSSVSNSQFQLAARH